MFAGILYLAGRRLWYWILEETTATEIRQGSDILHYAASGPRKKKKLHLTLVAQIRIITMMSQHYCVHAFFVLLTKPQLDFIYTSPFITDPMLTKESHKKIYNILDII